MTIRWLEVEVIEKGGCSSIETFYFGASLNINNCSKPIKGTLYTYEDGTAKINLPHFKWLSFDTIEEAKEFIEKSFSCRSDLVHAVVEKENIYKNLCTNHVPSCLTYFDSKYSFKRERGIWRWLIRNLETDTKVGEIRKGYYGYRLILGGFAIADYGTRKEAEKLAKKILNEGILLEDAIYTHAWKQVMNLLDDWRW
tara:strand:- start:6341 stop:6931 length:591 start_codon:yes stop_codon:yes gene_type:complete